jgi:hypothetical protein
LKSREELIKIRLEQSLKHLGIDERILYEVRDGKRELENLSNYDDTFNDENVIEDILSINE